MPWSIEYIYVPNLASRENVTDNEEETYRRQNATLPDTASAVKGLKISVAYKINSYIKNYNNNFRGRDNPMGIETC